MRAFTRRNLIAGVAGILLTGASLLAFDSWLDRMVDTQGSAEVSSAARRAVSLAEARINTTIAALDALAAKNVNSCAPAHIEAMRQAVFATPTIKEIAIVGPDGENQCAHLAIALGERKIMATEPLSGPGDYNIDIVQIGTGQPLIRLRHKFSSGGNSIAALMPVSLLLPQVTVDGSPFSAYAQIATRDGILLGATGDRPSASDARFTIAMQSTGMGLTAELVVPRELVPAIHTSVRLFGLLAIGAVVLLLVGFGVLMSLRRGPANPVADIEAALAAGEFIPYYQPIVDIRSGQLRGAEVLVRWKKPDGSIVLPGAFIPLAESSGLIREMTRDLMRRVCVEAGSAFGRRRGLKVAFNIAGQLFGDDSIIKDVVKIFSRSPIKLNQVVLEVTERDPIENFTVTRQTIAAFQGLGVRIAIDDVGTGHSGLSYMLKLGVDIIKIDKMFVDAIGSDRNSTTIVETLVDLAHNMRMDVVAEGVENFEQVMHLRELGIRSAQGYVFAPPLPGTAFLQLVESLDPLPAETKADAARTSAA